MRARYPLIITLFALAATAAAGPSSNLAILDEAVLLAAAVPTAASEQRLNELVSELGSVLPDERTRSFVVELTSRPAPVWVKHPEGPGSIPLVDVGATARAVTRHWDRLAARRLTATGMQKRDSGLVQQFFTSDDVARAGLLDAIAFSAPADLIVHRDAAAQRLDEPGGDELAAAIGLRLADTVLLRQVIDNGEARIVQRLLGALDEHLDKASRLALLTTALDRPALASMALFHIAALDLPAARDQVWALLRDPQLGATSAAILARSMDSETVRRLDLLLRNDPDPLTRQRAALALSLSDDPQARARASDTADQP